MDDIVHEVLTTFEALDYKFDNIEPFSSLFKADAAEGWVRLDLERLYREVSKAPVLKDQLQYTSITVEVAGRIRAFREANPGAKINAILNGTRTPKEGDLYVQTIGRGNKLPPASIQYLVHRLTIEAVIKTERNFSMMDPRGGWMDQYLLDLGEQGIKPND